MKCACFRAKITGMARINAILEAAIVGVEEKLNAVSARAVETMATAREEVHEALLDAFNQLGDSPNRAQILRIRDALKSRVGMALLKASQAFGRDAKVAMKPDGGDIMNGLNSALSKETV
jgi:hypothetical protein